MRRSKTHAPSSVPTKSISRRSTSRWDYEGLADLPGEAGSSFEAQFEDARRSPTKRRAPAATARIIVCELALILEESTTRPIRLRQPSELPTKSGV